MIHEQLQSIIEKNNTTKSIYSFVLTRKLRVMYCKYVSIEYWFTLLVRLKRKSKLINASKYTKESMHFAYKYTTDIADSLCFVFLYHLYSFSRNVNCCFSLSLFLSSFFLFFPSLVSFLLMYMSQLCVCVLMVKLMLMQLYFVTLKCDYCSEVLHH